MESKSEKNRETVEVKKGISQDQKNRARCNFANNVLTKGDFIRCYCQHPDGIPNMAIIEDVCPKSKDPAKEKGFWDMVARVKIQIKMETK